MWQRIYATAFWSKKELDEYLTFLEEAQKIYPDTMLSRDRMQIDIPFVD